MTFSSRINMKVPGNIEIQSRRLGCLGFALAKGLIRGLIDRYPDPSLATGVN